MWPFKSDRGKDIRNAFKGFTDGTAMDKITGEVQADSVPEIKHIQYVLVLVDETGFIKSDGLVDHVIDSALHHDAMIDSITASYISMLINTPLALDDPKEKRLSLVKELSESCGTSLAIIHGECECLVGVFGSRNRMNYTAMIPDYKSKLRTLASLEYGQIREIKEP